MSQTNKDRPAVDTAGALAGWLAGRMEGASGVRIDELNTPSANGFSNITMLFEAVWRSRGAEHRRRFVARVEPTGEGLFPSYDVSRQFDVMRALESSAVPVPKVLWMERDTAIFGAPFMVMEYIGGHIPSDDPSFAASGWVLSLDPRQRRKMLENALAALVKVHAVDWRARGLEWLRRPGEGSSVERELAYYEHFYRWAAKDLRVPAVEAGLAWAKARIPERDDLVLSWGDSRIGNMIFGDDLGVRAVIDWEGASLASREKDLGHWLQLTHVFTEEFGLELPQGFPDRTALLWRYEQLSRRRLNDVHFYEVMSGIHSSIQVVRAMSMMAAASGGERNDAAILNNQFTRGLARLIGFEMQVVDGLDVFTGKAARQDP
jgi:aminoglycoside phosphotransferase (APT) family kinase protein